MLDRKSCGLVFDLDGTLIESAPAIRAVGNDFLETLGLEALSLEETIACIGGGSPQFVRLMLTARGAFDQERFDQHFSHFTSIYNQAPTHLNQPFAGAEEALRAMAAKGHPLALCTNKPAAPTIRILDALGWNDLFGSVIAGDTLSVKKPDPTPLLEAARRIGCHSLLYFGDSEVDAETATNAKRSFVLFTEGYRKTAIENIVHAANFSDYGQLMSVVDELLGIPTDEHFDATKQENSR